MEKRGIKRIGDYIKDLELILLVSITLLSLQTYNLQAKAKNDSISKVIPHLQKGEVWLPSLTRSNKWVNTNEMSLKQLVLTRKQIEK